MPKSSGGGGGGSLFTSNVTGPPPGPNTVGTSEFIALGTIPAGLRIWFGSGQYASPDKSITFEIRTSNTGKSAGTDADTSLLAAVSVSPRSGLVTSDYYKRGTLHVASVTGTGAEKFWLRCKSRSGSAGSYLFSINYTTE